MILQLHMHPFYSNDHMITKISYKLSYYKYNIGNG